MILELLEAPKEEPITLEEALAYMRLGTAEEIAALYAPPPPTSLEEPEAASPARKHGSTSIVLDWETHLYDFTSDQVLPIHIPLSQQFNELRETLESRIAMLETMLTALSSTASPAPEAGERLQPQPKEGAGLKSPSAPP